MPDIGLQQVLLRSSGSTLDSRAGYGVAHRKQWLKRVPITGPNSGLLDVLIVFSSKDVLEQEPEPLRRLLLRDSTAKYVQVSDDAAPGEPVP